MVWQIVIEAETPGDSRTAFRLPIDASSIAQDLSAVQAHTLPVKSSSELPGQSKRTGRSSPLPASQPSPCTWRDPTMERRYRTVKPVSPPPQYAAQQGRCARQTLQ